MATTMPAIACEVFSAPVFGVQLADPFIILPSLGALLVGYLCGMNLWGAGLKSESIPFFGFAIMMTEAGFTHTSSRYLSKFGAQAFEIIDVGLTSTIALAFFVLALQDLGWLSKIFRKYLGLLVFLAGPVWYGWVYAILLYPSPHHMNIAFFWLYLVLVAVTCGFFGIVQLKYLFNGRFAGGLKPLVVALIAGALGMKAIFICSFPDVRLSGEFWWFLLSDVSMYFLHRYFLLRSTPEE